MATPLIVNVVELLRWPGSTKDVDISVAYADFDFGNEQIVDQPIQVTVHLESLSTGIMVNGSAGAEFVAECRRCLKPLREHVDVAISELYQQVLEDPDAYAIENDQINLLPMVRENILLSVPVGPLCSPDCPGFCPECGVDLSEGECGCRREVSDPRWAALEALKDKLETPSE